MFSVFFALLVFSYYYAILSSSPQNCRSLWADQATWAGQLCQQADEAFAQQDLHRAYQLARELKPFKPPLPALLHEDGTRVSSAADIAARLTIYHGQVQHTTPVHAERLKADTDETAIQLPGVPLNIACVPSLADLTGGFSRVKRRRGPGEDRVPGYVLTMFSPTPP